MARDSSAEPDRRRRDREGHRKKHDRRKSASRDHDSGRTPTTTATSESMASGSGTRTSGSSGQQLSMNALAQLNEYNTRYPPPADEAPPREREKKRRSRPKPAEDDYTPVEADSPRATPQKEKRRAREGSADVNRERRRPKEREGDESEDREARRERRRRRKEAQTDDERDLNAVPRRERRERGEAYTEDERDVRATPRKERRRKEAHTDGEANELKKVDKRRSRAIESDDEQTYRDKRHGGHDGRKKRIVSGAVVEEGRAKGFGGFALGLRGGRGTASKHSSYNSIDAEKEELYSAAPRAASNKKKRKWIIAGVAVVVLIVVITVAVVVSKKNQGLPSGNKGLDGTSENTIPSGARGTYLDPFTWLDTKDFNVTYTNETVGDLPVMGLFSTWDDSAKANDKVKALNEDWGDYAKTPARGVNVGGWLSLEPFITPSLFNYDSKLGIIDEFTLCKHLGAKTAATTLEKHYSTFVTEQTFQDIQAAGLDHVRIPYSYWAVQTYDDDPYVFRTSWRYLLRAIEWCRKYGLRVNLDLHALPGSQNGWNHSGRLGAIGWLNGTNGGLNSQRSLDVHDRLSKFFAQDRYKNIVTFYGLANEPRMVLLDTTAVTSWTTQAYNVVRKNGITKANIVFGDGFMGLGNWQGKLTGLSGLVLDVHQYVIFNNDQIVYTHQKKVQYACDGWTQQTQDSMNTAKGFGPTMFAEWSQADTDCATYLTNVGWGNRWTGTYSSGNATLDALTPKCPAKDSSCSCSAANAAVGSYSAQYKQFLKMFAEAQMSSFEKGWGWFYWTWDTESAPLWSYKQGLAAGILPAKAYDRDFKCDSAVPDFAGLSETF